MHEHKRLSLKRERLRTLVPAQLGRVVGGDTNTESFDLNCDSYNCITLGNTGNTGNTNTGNTIGGTNTITIGNTDPILNVTTAM